MSYINSTLEDVKFHIETQDFDGPIDLLVKFVKESKIDIMEIFVSDITSQYVNYVQNMQELNYEYVSQYIIFAALLIEIKSQKMLPPAPVEDDGYGDMGDYGEDDYYGGAEDYIIEQVKKKLLDDYPEKLKPREVINVFYPKPQYDESDYKLVAKNLTLEKLLESYKLILEKIELENTTPKVQTIVKDRFTVTEKVKDITSRIRSVKKVSFFSLFEKDYTKTEMLTVFLAVLEIIRKQVAVATQDGYDTDIYLEHNDKEDKIQDEGELTNDVEEYN